MTMSPSTSELVSYETLTSSSSGRIETTIVGVSTLYTLVFDTPSAYTTIIETSAVVSGSGIDASTVGFSTYGTATITDAAVFSSLAQSEDAPSSSSTTSSNSTTITSSTQSPSPSPSPGLSASAKTGIGVAVPLVVVGAFIGIYLLFLRYRRPNRKSTYNNNTSQPYADTYRAREGKSELYAGHVDPYTTHGPVFAKPELSTIGAKHLPTELDDTPILEADGRMRGQKQQYKTTTRRKPIPSTEGSTQGSSVPSDVTTVVASGPPMTQRRPADRELIEEADAAVAELGLLAVRKKALMSQAAATRKRPEDVEGRKGEEYRQLLAREDVVRRRLGEIEVERGG